MSEQLQPLRLTALSRGLKTGEGKKALLLLAGVFLLVVTWVVTGLWLQHKAFLEEKTRLTEEVRHANIALTEHAAQIIKQADSALHAVRLFYLRTGSVEETAQFTDALGFDKSVIDNIYLISADGRVVISHDGRPGAKSVVERDFFVFHQKQTQDQLSISVVEPGIITGKYHFRVSRRIDAPDGSFAGLVLATVNPQAFTSHFREVNITEHTTVALLGTVDRKLRARYPEPDAAAWGNVVQSQLWDLLSAQPTGIYEAKGYFDQVERVSHFQKVGDLPLVMVVGIPLSDVFHNAEIRFQGQAMVMMMILVTTLMLLLVVSLMAVSRARLASANKKLTDLYGQMRTLALFDGLTGLPGRLLFFDRLSKELARARRSNKSVAVMFLDLDGFKAVNDQFGHDAGDVVLKTVASRWLACVREADTVARFGGDEFAIILGEMDNTADAQVLADKLIASLALEIVLNPTSVAHVGVSIGVSFYPTNGTEMDSLVAAADAAMYESKMHGKNTCTVSTENPPKDDDHQGWVVLRDADLVGIQKIDEQHLQLVRMVNQINQQLTHDADPSLTEPLFEKLLKFTEFHFQTEHRFMVEYNYPEQAGHDAEHERLVQEISRITAELREGTDLLVLQTIKDWLVRHIQYADQPLGVFLQQKGCH